MVRVKRGNVAAKRRKKYLNLAKGFVGSQSRLSTLAAEQVVQSLNFAYISRRLKKEILDEFGFIELMLLQELLVKNIYSKFIGCLRDINVFLDRKILATLAFTDLSAFNVIERQSRKSKLYK